MEYEIVKAYRKDDKLRGSFNRLAVKTFGLNFEDWYQNGYWGEGYIPYSVLIDGEVAANVSVSLMEFKVSKKASGNEDNEVKKYIQLGTVMTDEAYRNKGYIRALIAEIEKDFPLIDGIYLFANDGVLDFYPKFGFAEACEYQYSKKADNKEPMSAKPVPMKTKEDWAVFEQVVAKSNFASSFEMINNVGLIMFYVTKFMQECVYYIESAEAYVVAEIEDDSLLIHCVFSEKQVDLDEIIRAFGNGINEVVLGFTSIDTTGYEVKKFKEEDTTLFVKGNAFREFSKELKMFPTLSHT